MKTSSWSSTAVDLFCFNLALWIRIKADLTEWNNYLQGSSHWLVSQRLRTAARKTSTQAEQSFYSSYCQCGWTRNETLKLTFCTELDRNLPKTSVLFGADRTAVYLLWPLATVNLVVMVPSHFCWLIALKSGIVVYILTWISFYSASQMGLLKLFSDSCSWGTLWTTVETDPFYAFNVNHGQFTLIHYSVTDTRFLWH